MDDSFVDNACAAVDSPSSDESLEESVDESSEEVLSSSLCALTSSCERLFKFLVVFSSFLESDTDLALSFDSVCFKVVISALSDFTVFLSVATSADTD